MKSQPKNEKYADGSVGVRVRGFKGMEWQHADDLCECETKEAETHVFFSCANTMLR